MVNPNTLQIKPNESAAKKDKATMEIARKDAISTHKMIRNDGLAELFSRLLIFTMMKKYTVSNGDNMSRPTISRTECRNKQNAPNPMLRNSAYKL